MYILPDTPDPVVSVPDDTVIRTVYPARQQTFYSSLAQDDAETFELFCRGKQNPVRIGNAHTQTVPSLLLFPMHTYAAVFSERYTSRILSHNDPLPGAMAYALDPSVIRRLVEQYAGHHLILSLLCGTLSDLYSATSPILAGVSPLVKTILAEMEQLQNPRLLSDTLPCLKSYRTELYASDTPVFLDLLQILSRLAAWLPASPLFSSLELAFQAPVFPSPPESYQVRFSASAFMYVFVLLSHVLGSISDDGLVTLSLYRQGTNACLTFHIESDRIPTGFSCRNEFHSLSSILTRYAGIFTLVQYLLHRSNIGFLCTVSPQSEWPSLEITLEMDTRFREEIEFRCGDIDEMLFRTLPDALELLRLLTE